MVLFLCFGANAVHLIQPNAVSASIKIFLAKLASNLMQICPKQHHNLHHFRKLMQIRCQKGAGTKIHKCLVWNI